MPTLASLLPRGGRPGLGVGSAARDEVGGLVDVHWDSLRFEPSSARLLSTPGRSYRPASSATSGANVSATLAPKAK